MTKLFVHIGYHKTATTWLQEVFFNRHPQIAYLGKAQSYPVPDLIDIFHSLYEDSDTRFSVAENRMRFKKIMESHPLMSQQKTIGMSDEGLSGGGDWFGSQPQIVADRIREVFADNEVKIIIGIREQVSMINSIYTEYLKWGGTKSLERLLFQKGQPGRFLIDKVQYSALIGYYMNLFGREQVFVYLLEEIKEDEQKVADDISVFLDIDRIDVKAGSRCIAGLSSKLGKINLSPSRLGLAMIRFINRFFHGPYNNQPLLPVSQAITLIGRFILTRSIVQRVLKGKYKFFRDSASWNYFQWESYINGCVCNAIILFILKVDQFLFSWCGRGWVPQNILVSIEDEIRMDNRNLQQLINKPLGNFDYLL